MGVEYIFYLAHNKPYVQIAIFLFFLPFFGHLLHSHSRSLQRKLIINMLQHNGHHYGYRVREIYMYH